jgi:DNA-binding IclR family transcriptional regulator
MIYKTDIKRLGTDQVMSSKENRLHKVIQGTKSFSRNIEILQLIADAPRPPSLTDILEDSDLTRPTLYRVLAALEAELLIVLRPEKRYSLGPRLISLARNALANNDIRQIARVDLERLGDETGETVHLAIPSGTQMMIIDKMESREVVRMASVIGMLVPFHTTGVGKAFLVGLKPQKLSDLINRLPMEQITSFTTTDPVKLQQKIVKAQKDGFIIDDQENENGIVCYGAPIVNARGEPVASVSVSTPSFRLNKNRSYYIEPLLNCAKAISDKLNY